MSATVTRRHERAHYASVRRVLVSVLFANLAVTLVKIALGLVTGALAVVADGFHSLVDTSSNLIGLAAIRLADRPADERYPYGYQRYETVGALAIGVMLLAAAWEIARAIVERLTAGGQPHVTTLTLGLVLLTFPVNLAIVILETRAGRRLNSEILLADATHTRADLFVTASVVASLVGVWLGLPWLDWLVATLVVGMILRASFRILRDSASWLSDAMIADPEKIEAIAEGVPGVLYVHRVRSRGTPRAGFVDLHVKVHPGMSTSQAHAIASEVERRLMDRLPGVMDALVHIEPGRHDGASDWDQIAYDLRQIADGMGVSLHDLHVHVDGDGGYAIELHLELPTGITLGEAHNLAEEFEAQVQARWPQASSVITHLEPIDESMLADAAEVDPALLERLRTALGEYVGEENVLELNAHLVGEHTGVAVRLVMPAETSLAAAHARAEQIERDLLIQFRGIDRVLIHLEPPVQ